MIKTQKLGLALVIFGVLVLVAAFWAYTSTTISVAGVSSIPITTYPYRSDAFPLILLSVALFVIGFALMAYRPKSLKSA
jgi:uncharacterized membrane protein YidH (DUF202 family)